MKIETEIKLAIKSDDIGDIVKNVELAFECEKMPPFHQVTHQFFLDDFTKQNVFPRIRNEENGEITLTIKVKTKDKSDFFQRIELETSIGNTDDTIKMMRFLGFPEKISWEKMRHSFTVKSNQKICFSLDETPIGWFLEIEGDEELIEDAIIKLNLQNQPRTNKPYLALWEKYKQENNISKKDMMFTDSGE